MDSARFGAEYLDRISQHLYSSVLADILDEAGHRHQVMSPEVRPLYPGAKVLSSVHFECGHDSRFIAASGTLVNFIAGFLCWIGLRAVNAVRGHLRYFLWLLMTINLLQGGGYFLFSGLANFGDWAYVIHDLEPA